MGRTIDEGLTELSIGIDFNRVDGGWRVEAECIGRDMLDTALYTEVIPVDELADAVYYARDKLQTWHESMEDRAVGNHRRRR